MFRRVRTRICFSVETQADDDRALCVLIKRALQLFPIGSGKSPNVQTYTIDGTTITVREDWQTWHCGLPSWLFWRLPNWLIRRMLP